MAYQETTKRKLEEIQRQVASQLADEVNASMLRDPLFVYGHIKKHKQLQQEHAQLEQQLAQLQQEHAQLQQEHAQLQQKHTQLQVEHLQAWHSSTEEWDIV
jgi:DNA-binding transcriptional MerR regulator